MKHLQSFIFCTICVIFISALNPEEAKGKFVPCGLYGFRCLDKKRAQICDEKYDADSCSPRPRIFECADGLVCDEDKKEFCAVMEPSYTNCTSSQRQNLSVKSKRSQAYSVRKKAWEDLFDDALEPVTSTTQSITSNDDEEGETTEKHEIDPWNGSPPMVCTSHGFYPDTNNKSLFFFCDLKKSGNGFILRHMRCGPNRMFDANFKSCVLNGTTRNIRNEAKAIEPRIVEPQLKQSEFTCDKKNPGKYPDANDCHIYHLCLLPQLYAPFEHLTVECPHSTAYNPDNKRCSKKTKKFCKKQGKKEKFTSVNCEEEIRFREIRSCNTYFLCYHDQVVEFLCASGLKFDEKLQFCVPAHFVKCE